MRRQYNKLLKTFIIVFLSVLICNSMIITSKYEVKGVNSTSEIVMDVKTKRVLYERDARSKRYMASTTKILTAITVIENFDIEKVVIVPKETVGIEGSSIYLDAGEELKIIDLLYGLMLRSGNDCAETLAVVTCGSINKFVELMNKTAQKIGAFNSNFTNPHGLHDDNHYTTAYDLGLISCYAIQNPIFKKIVSTKCIKIPHTTKDTTRVLINKNKMLSNLKGASGIKTGFTKKAGRCLVTSCERDGIEVVSVVLNCPSMWQVSENLINDCFNCYKNVKIADSDNILAFIDTQNGEKCGVYIKNDVILPLKESEKLLLKTEIDCPKLLKTGTRKDTEIGLLKIYIKNNLIFQEKIYNIVDI